MLETVNATTIAELGTILSIWAHPDDETYLAGGLMASARDGGQRVVCASATAHRCRSGRSSSRRCSAWLHPSDGRGLTTYGQPK